MKFNLRITELEKIYELLKAYDEGLIVNPSEDWELEHYDEQLVDRKELGKILRRIEGLLDGKAEGIRKKILLRRYDTYSNEIDEAVYRKLLRAFTQRARVDIGYFDMRKAEVKGRAIDIYHMTRKHVIAYCHLRKAMRKFRTSRVVTVRVLDVGYHIPNTFNKNDY